MERIWQNDSFEELDLANEPKRIKKISLKKTFTEYLRQSTVHGLKYTVGNESRTIDKAFWIVCLVISACIFMPLLICVLRQWNDSPVVISLIDNPEPIWNIPFPAVTICPVTKSKKAEFNFTKTFISTNGFLELKNLSNDEVTKIGAIAQVCNSELYTDLYSNETVTDNTLFDRLENMAPHFNDTIFLCRMRNKAIPCKNQFSKVWTEEGLCFTYNILNSTDMFKSDEYFPSIVHNLSAINWNRESGYKKEMPTSDENQLYPYHVHSAGNSGSVIIVLKAFKDDLDYICRGAVMGFNVHFHSPDELPQMSKHLVHIPLDMDTGIVVKPHVLKLSDQLRDYPPHKRKCYLKSERPLEFFKHYTQSNCELECLSKYIINKCGCAKYSMPKNDSIPICGASNVKCYREAEGELLDKNVIDSISTDSFHCNCLPNCHAINYDLEISHSTFDYNHLYASYGYAADLWDNDKMARLRISFKDTYFMPTRRYAIQNHAEMLATGAALLSFFFGASAISVIELIYHLTFHLWFSKDSNQNKAQTINLQ